jgi:excisionase family DNA binding protein
MTEQIKDRKRYMNVDEVADYLGFSEHTIRSWMKTRKIPIVKFDRAVRFDTDKIDIWLKDKEVPVLGNRWLSFCLSDFSRISLKQMFTDGDIMK